MTCCSKGRSRGRILVSRLKLWGFNIVGAAGDYFVSLEAFITVDWSVIKRVLSFLLVRSSLLLTQKDSGGI